MRIWQLHELGDPGTNLLLEEVDAPQVDAGQLLLDIEAVGLSFPDVLSCRGEYQVKTRTPYTPGGESAGTIAAVGDGVEGFEVGDRVVTLGGGLREQAIASPNSTFVIPDSLSFEKAAAIPVNYGTTWFALHDRGKLQAGETLLVAGAAGGTGSAAIQLGKAAGARVIAVAGGAEKAQLARDLGADVAIDHRETPSWVDAVREASGGGVDVAYDPVGGDTFHQIRRCMAWDGRLLVIGFVAGIADAPTNHALLKNYSIVGVHWGASLMRDQSTLRRQLTSVLDLAASGDVDPLLNDPIYSFDEAAGGLQDLADRKVFGKAIVIR